MFCGLRTTRSSESASNESGDNYKTLRSIIAFLILILILLVFFVGFLSYRKNEKQIERKQKYVASSAPKSEEIANQLIENQSVGRDSKNESKTKTIGNSPQNSNNTSKDSISIRSE